jgi:uracil phosphoribosyltransferase
LRAEAERDARAAVELSSEDSGGTRSEALEILGRIQLDNGDLAAAKETLQSGLIVSRAASGGTRYEVIALNYLARVHTYLGELDTARRMLTDGLNLDRSLHREAHADTAWTLDNLGLVELAVGDLDAAEEYFRRALDIEASVHGPEHPRSGWSLRNLAQTLLRKGDVAAAIPYYARSLEVIEHATPGNRKEISATLRGLAEAEALRGNQAAADGYARRLEDLRTACAGLAASDDAGDTREMKSTIVDHPVVAEQLSVLRARETDNQQFRTVLRSVSLFLVYEAVRRLETVTYELVTPVAPGVGVKIDRSPLIVPIMRAGLGMLDAATTILPDSEVAFVGIAKDGHSALRECYLSTLPDDIGGGRVIVLDPMLATGYTAAFVCDDLLRRNAGEILLVSLLSATEGIDYLER